MSYRGRRIPSRPVKAIFAPFLVPSHREGSPDWAIPTRQITLAEARELFGATTPAPVRARRTTVQFPTPSGDSTGTTEA